MNRDTPISDSDENDPSLEPGESEMELALGRLSLRSPSPELDQRLAKLLSSSRPRERTRSVLFAAAASVAIALGTVPLILHHRWNSTERMLVQTPVVQPAPSRPARSPLRVERQFARVSDNGIVGTDHGVPLQLLHYIAVRQIWYFDPRTGKKLQVTVPEDEAFLVPIQTF